MTEEQLAQLYPEMYGEEEPSMSIIDQETINYLVNESIEQSYQAIK